MKFSIQGSDKKPVPRGKCSWPQLRNRVPLELRGSMIPLTDRVRKGFLEEEAFSAVL